MINNCVVAGGCAFLQFITAYSITISWGTSRSRCDRPHTQFIAWITDKRTLRQTVVAPAYANDTAGMTSTIALNQVDLGAVAGLVSGIQGDAAKAATTWSAAVRWTGGFQSEGSVRGFSPIASDEPKTLGGRDTAPNPVEQLLAAFGNCLAVGYAANATIAGIEIDSLAISLEGDLDLHVFLGLTEGHAGFSAIRATVDLRTSAANNAVEALHAKVAATSPVGHTLGNPVAVTISPK